MPFYLVDGKLLVTDGKLSLSEDCCCNPCVACPTGGEYELTMEDLDNAWNGNVDLGPHTLSWNGASNLWEASIAYDLCDGTKTALFQLTCGNNGQQWVFTVTNESGVNQPLAGAVSGGTGETQNFGECTENPVFEFQDSVDANGACWPSSGGRVNFRFTFVRL